MLLTLAPWSAELLTAPPTRTPIHPIQTIVQLVYGELRDVIFERLYRFHVQVSRLEMVLQVRGPRARAGGGGRGRKEQCGIAL